MSVPVNDREEAILRIAVDYIEMPDLIVTVRQASRLWNMPLEICERALATLVERGFLAKTKAGAFLRRSTGESLALARAS